MVLSCDIGSYDAEIAPQMFRFLREPEHSAAISEGCVWLSTLSACRAYEAEGQGDAGEAIHEYDTGQLSGDGDDAEFRRRAAIRGVKVHPGAESIVIWHNNYTSTLVDAYVLCLTEQDSPENRATFGQHGVRVRPPTDALIAISEALGAHYDVTTAMIGRIHYRPRGSQGDERSPGPLGFVKPTIPFAPQREWRMLWTVAPRHSYIPFLLDCPALKPFCAPIVDSEAPERGTD